MNYIEVEEKYSLKVITLDEKIKETEENLKKLKNERSRVCAEMFSMIS